MTDDNMNNTIYTGDLVNTTVNVEGLSSINTSTSTITITTASDITSAVPKTVKGGVFAPADIELIKKALDSYTRLDISDAEQRQVANLLHRLNSRI